MPSPELEDLTQHSNVGVRWQAQMEQYLGIARERLLTASRITSITDPRSVSAFTAHVALAQAASTAALALSIANIGSDMELAAGHLEDAAMKIAIALDEANAIEEEKT